MPSSTQTRSILLGSFVVELENPINDTTGMAVWLIALSCMIHNDLKWLGTSIFSDSRGGSGGSGGISQGNTLTPLTSTQIGSAHFSRSPEQLQWLFLCITPLTSSHPTKALGYFQRTHPAASQRSNVSYLCWKFNANAPPLTAQLTFME